MRTKPLVNLYELLDMIGEGTNSRVYLARHISGELRALKVFQPRTASDDSQVRFCQELHNLFRLSHPHLVKLLDFGSTADTNEDYLATDFFDGTDFIVASQHLSQVHFLSLLIQLLNVLQYLHSRRIVHGDLKPSNILVRERTGTNPHLQLLDLGNAITREDMSFLRGRGTPAYMAPELFDGEASPQTDLYSLGVLLYQCIAGTLPFDGTDISHVITQHKYTPVPPLVPGPLSFLYPLIYQLLAKDPGRRPSSAGEVLRTIRAGANIPLVDDHFRAALTAAQSAPLVGCDSLLGHWDQLVRRSPSERPFMVLVTAGRGGGKTRFLYELAIRSRVDGSSVFIVQWSDILHAGADHFRIGHADRRVILFIDNYTPSTGAILARLVRAHHKHIQGIVLTAHVTEPHDQLTGSLTDALALGCELFHWALPLLSSDDWRVLCSYVLMAPTDQPTADTIARLCGGVPLLGCRIIAHAVSERRLERRERYDVMVESLVPLVERQDVGSYHDHDLAHLSSDDLCLLQGLSTADQTLTVGELSGLTCIDASTVETRCRGLARQRLVIQKGTAHSLEFGVFGEVLRASILKTLSPDARRNLFCTLAKWHESMPGDHCRAGKAATAYKEAGQIEDAIRCAVQAASGFYQLDEFEDAATWFQLALSLHAPKTAPHAIILPLADCLSTLGKVTDAADLLASIDLATVTPEDRCRLLLFRARVARQTGRFSLVEEWARDALSLTRHLSDPRLRIGAMLHMGISLCWQDKSQEGHRLLVRAATEARRLNLRPPLTEALRELGSSHWKLGNHHTALSYLRRADRISASTGDSPDRAALILNIGILYGDLGLYSHARAAHRRALRMASKFKAQRHLATIHNNIGETHRAQGSWSRALRAYRSARVSSANILTGMLPLMIASNTAVVLARLGYFSDSVDVLRHLLKTPARLRPTSSTLNVLLGWTTLFHCLGDFRRARRLASHGIDIATRAGAFSSVLDFHVLLASSTLASLEANQAHDTLLTAIQNFGHRAPFDAQRTAELVLFQAQWSLSRLDKDALTQFVRLVSQKGMRWHRASGIFLSAQLTFADGNYGEAASTLEEIVGITRTIGDRSLLWQAYYLLGRCGEQQLLYERALRCYRIATITIHELATNIADTSARDLFLHQAHVKEAVGRYSRLRTHVGRAARHDIALATRNERASRRMIGALSTIGHKLSSILTLADLLPSIIDLAIANVGAERGLIFLRDFRNHGMRVECARGIGKEVLEDVTSYSRSVIQRAAEGHGLLTVDVGKDSKLSAYDSLVLHDIKSILCVPMRVRGKVTGVIYLDTRKTTRMFTEREKAFIESFASQAAIAIENARLFGHMQAENARLRRAAMERGRFENIVGTSPAIKSLSEMIGGVLDSPCNVLIVGESGTGKELVARAIHCNGPRHDQKFIPLDCGALPEALLEAELFGHARGAFTGAERERIGLIEAAHGGTLFLDEITNLGVALQSKLLRVLQEREIRRLGENAARPIDVRVLAATNADIEELVAQNRFRQDLYYRLNVVKITVPPLRDRREDIPLIVDHFLRRRGEDGRAVKGVAPEVMTELARHDWPGNVRELENVVERLAVLSPGTLIRLEDLRTAGFGLRPDSASQHGASGRKTGEQIMIEDALRRHGGDKAKAARFIGWNRQKLYRRMKSFRIPADFGQAA